MKRAPTGVPATSELGGSPSPPIVVLVGNPNVGKTTLFNALTNSSARVGNYPGVTVERNVGRLELPCGVVELVDVPGAYSLSARAADERVAIAAALGLWDNPRPAVAVVVVDAGQLARNLYFALQLVEFGIPVVIAMTMLDEVSERPPIPARAGALLGVPCVAVTPRAGGEFADLRQALDRALRQPHPGEARIEYPARLREDVDRLVHDLPPAWRRNVEHDRALALWALLSLDDGDELDAPASLRRQVGELRTQAAAEGRDFDLEIVGARYAFLEPRLAQVYGAAEAPGPHLDWTERIDKLLLHPTYGFVIFVLLMLGLFQSLFAWADPAIALIESGVGALQRLAGSALPVGLPSELVVQGVLGGVGNVIVFLPQILLLFLLLGLLEDSGYMARVAYLMDRVLRGVGLHGKAFVPMLSGLACAVPAIMATRTMERSRDRLLTMLVVPLMSCSARLPVYTLIVGAMFPPSDRFGQLPTQGLLMTGMYVFSMLMTVLAAWVLGRTLVRGRHIPLILELPRYRWPSGRTILRSMFQRTRQFLSEAGTLILGFTVLMWFLLSFPREHEPREHEPSHLQQAETLHAEVAIGECVPDGRPKPYESAPPSSREAASECTPPSAGRAVSSGIERSYMGRMGKMVEPLVQPLGFDWKLAVGLIGAFSAREVFVSTLGLVFGIDDTDAAEGRPLRESLRSEKDAKGQPKYTPLVGLSLLVFFALACQCVSTLVVVHRETQSWRWPALLACYTWGLAYAMSFTIYQVGKGLGFG